MWGQAAIAALLSLLGVMLGASLQYYFGRTLEGRKQLALQRAQAYVDYFKAVVLLAQHGKSKDALALAADAKVRACIYGSPAVIKRLSDFEKAGASVNSSNGAATIIALLAEMRRDAGTIDGGITQKEFRDILPPPELRSPN